jgi:hypothetical protein
LELGLCLLARDLFLPELLLHRGERGGLVCQASPRPLRLLGPLFGLALPSARSLEGRTVLMELGPNRGQLAPPPLRLQGSRPCQILPLRTRSVPVVGG